MSLSERVEFLAKILGRRQSGWGYIQGDNTADMSEAVTFARAFSAAPLVLITIIGYRATADGTPTGPGWFTTGIKAWANSSSSATTGFTAGLHIATTFASTLNYGYVWHAIEPA